MTKLARILIAVGTLIVPAAYILAPLAVDAATPAYGSSTVTRVEHVGLRLETHPGACVRIDWTTSKDAGAFLSSEPDAAAGYPFSGPDAAIWAAGADAAVWIPPDSGIMGPRVLPKSGLSYICASRNNASCWKQGMAIDSCNYAGYFPADQNTAPTAFSPEPDGGQPVVMGVSTSGTANVTCCPLYPATLNGQ